MRDALGQTLASRTIPVRLMLVGGAMTLSSYFPAHGDLVTRVLHPTWAETVVSTALFVAAIPWRRTADGDPQA